MTSYYQPFCILDYKKQKKPVLSKTGKEEWIEQAKSSSALTLLFAVIKMFWLFTLLPKKKPILSKVGKKTFEDVWTGRGNSPIYPSIELDVFVFEKLPTEEIKKAHLC